MKTGLQAMDTLVFAHSTRDPYQSLTKFSDKGFINSHPYTFCVLLGKILKLPIICQHLWAMCLTIFRVCQVLKSIIEILWAIPKGSR